VTPTGAALLVNLNPEVINFQPEMNIEKVIYSTGQKSFDKFLNILRLFYGKPFITENIESPHPLQKYVEEISVLETDIDDVSGEILGNFINELQNEDILDIQLIPSVTKKNRPSNVIKVLCHLKNRFTIIEKIIHELGTLGVRYSTMERVCIDRSHEIRNVEINGKKYEANFKISSLKSLTDEEIINIKPEYEDLKKISLDSGIPVRKVQFILQGYINQNILKKN
ncbi:MAG: nickel insertion protein, partial [Candidatus Thorarchaeota archaeon]